MGVGVLKQIIASGKLLVSRNIKELRADAMLGRYYGTEASGEGEYPAPEGDYCEIVTVAFNNSRVIDYQITMLRRFFKTPFRYTVYDNSTNEEESKRIQEVCRMRNNGYVRLPKQYCIKPGMASYSHGIALNWIWKNRVSRSSAKYLAILDHDIFPVQDFYVEEYLADQPVYGLVWQAKKSSRVKEVVWHLWAGFGYFRMEYLRNKRIDFRPDWNKNADTGARNYEALYRKLDPVAIKTVKDKFFRFDTDSPWENGYGWFDCGWIHMWNGSNYTGSDKWEQKMDNIVCLLNSHLEEYAGTDETRCKG